MTESTAVIKIQRTRESKHSSPSTHSTHRCRTNPPQTSLTHPPGDPRLPSVQPCSAKETPAQQHGGQARVEIRPIPTSTPSLKTNACMCSATPLPSQIWHALPLKPYLHSRKFAWFTLGFGLAYTAGSQPGPRPRSHALSAPSACEYSTHSQAWLVALECEP